MMMMSHGGLADNPVQYRASRLVGEIFLNKTIYLGTLIWGWLHRQTCYYTAWTVHCTQKRAKIWCQRCRSATITAASQACLST